MATVQGHGFSWEKDIIKNVYGATQEELATIKYTSKMDLPASLNHLDGVNLSVKTTGRFNCVCMADALRIFDEVSSGDPFHMVVIHYTQDGDVKHVTTITEVDLTHSVTVLFGDVQRSQIEALVEAVKKVPQKRKPTEEEYKAIYDVRNEIQKVSGAIHFDPKVNSQQSRLQCSFNHFDTFLEQNPSRVVAKSSSPGCEFRGGRICPSVTSGRRVFKKSLQAPCL
jgi:hypothetical protein